MARNCVDCGGIHYHEATCPRFAAVPRTARWWHWHKDSWVKLSLRPGQVIELTGGGQHEEGYSCWAERFEHVGNGITSETCTWGRDCDGGHEDSWEGFCSIYNLASREGHDGTPVPRWTTVDAAQRDEYAEMAGY